VQRENTESVLRVIYCSHNQAAIINIQNKNFVFLNR
jgi:hypothetical protein